MQIIIVLSMVDSKYDLFSYDCFSFVETCTGGVCGSFVLGCLSNQNCYCFKMANGTGFCSQNFYCNLYADCASCPSSTSVCLVSTCCGQPVCAPLSLGTACKSSSTSSTSNFIAETLFKQPNQKTAADP